MASNIPVFRSQFSSPNEEALGRGRRPVVFDILGPDWETSILPEDLRLVLHVNPQSMSIKYARVVTRIQTQGGYVEQHWGDGSQNIDFDMVTGGFMRLYTGLSNITGTKYGGGRRETIAYDKFLDALALFHNNGSVFDVNGNIVYQGILKVTFDGGVFLGWFTNFTVTESAEKPYQFTMTAGFEVHKEIQVWRTTLAPASDSSLTYEIPDAETGQIPFDDLGGR